MGLRLGLKKHAEIRTVRVFPDSESERTLDAGSLRSPTLDPGPWTLDPEERYWTLDPNPGLGSRVQGLGSSES